MQAPTLSGRIAAGIAVVSAAALTACADKVYAPPRSADATIPVQVAMQGATGTRTIRVRADYQRAGGSRVVIKEDQFQAQVGEQQVAFTIDLSSCLADSSRAGSRTGCDLMIGVGLYDSTQTVLDSLAFGPFTAQPGRPLDVVDASLAVQRFAVREWHGDDALMLGGTDGPPTIRTISGYTTPGGTAVPLVVQGVVDETGQLRGSLYAVEGGAWRRLAAQAGAFFFDVAGVNATEIWVSGSTGLFRFDGTALTQIAGITDSLFAVGARVVGGNRLVVAAGSGGAVWTGDGTAWQKHTFTGERFTDACVSSLTEAFAGTREGSVYRFDGNAWTLTPTPFPAPKFGMQCPGPGQAFAFDTLSLLSWNGAGWTGHPHPYPATGILINWAAPDGGGPMLAAGIRPNFGGPFETVVSQFIGGAWQETGNAQFAQSLALNGMWASSNGLGFVAHGSFSRTLSGGQGTGGVLTYHPALRDVWVSSANHAVAIGWNLFLARWNGTRWTIDPPPTGMRRTLVLHGVWSDGPSNIWVVGNAPLALHWNGSTWNTVINTADAGFGQPFDVWGSGNTVFMAGTQLIRCVGEQCTPQALAPGGVSMLSIWGSALNNVFAVGELGTIMRYDGTSWTQMTSPTTRNLRNVWGTGPNDVWALGDSVLARYNGTTWSSVPMTGDLAQVMTGPSASQAVIRSGLWASSPNDVYVGGDNGRIARFDGGTWRLMPTTITRRIIAIHGATNTGALAIGDSFAGHAGPTLLRGASATGTFGSAMQRPLTWY